MSSCRHRGEGSLSLNHNANGIYLSFDICSTLIFCCIFYLCNFKIDCVYSPASNKEQDGEFGASQPEQPVVTFRMYAQRLSGYFVVNILVMMVSW